MLTIKAVVLKGGKRKDSTYNVKIQITCNRRTRRISTSLFASEADLTRSLALKEGTRVKMLADRIAGSYREKCYETDGIESMSVEEIAAFLKGEKDDSPIDFLQFCQDWIDGTKAKGKKNYQSSLNSFKEYLGKDTLPIGEVTSSLIKGFIGFLERKAEERNIRLGKEGKRIPSRRMISLYPAGLRHLFKEAMRRYNDYDRNILRIKHSPFDYVSLPKQEAARKRALSIEQIRNIESLCKELPEGRARLSGECFMLSFFLMGMNSADLYECSLMENNVISYNRAKTRDRRLDRARMDVRIPERAMHIAEKYRDPSGEKVFSFHRRYSSPADFNRALNIGLKTIGKRLGIEDLEFYAARHSWATIAINKAGIDKYTVHEALNHIDESMKVTDIYIERSFENENNANDKVIATVFT